MKKVVMFVVALTITAFAVSAMAGFADDLGNAVKKETKNQAAKQVKGATSKELNKDLAKYKCSYNAKSRAVSGCDLNAISSKIAGQNIVAEAAGNHAGTSTDHNLYVKTSNDELYQKISAKMKVSSWDVWQDRTGPKDSATFYVKIE